MHGHASHDWSPHSWTCIGCACRYGSIAAQFQCVPSTDDSRPCDTEPAEVDWFELNRSASGA